MTVKGDYGNISHISRDWSSNGSTDSFTAPDLGLSSLPQCIALIEKERITKHKDFITTDLKNPLVPTCALHGA